MNPDEEFTALVVRAQRQDAEAFSALIHRFERTALAIAYATLGDASLAGDAVQEAFLKAWQKLATLEDVTRFVPWLLGIVRNAAVDQRRRAKPVAAVSEGIEEDSRADADPAASLIRQEQRSQVDAALRSLDETARTIIILRYYENLPSRQIGQMLGLSTTAVDMRLSRAKKELKGHLTEPEPTSAARR